MTRAALTAALLAATSSVAFAGDAFPGGGAPAGGASPSGGAPAGEASPGGAPAGGAPAGGASGGLYVGLGIGTNEVSEGSGRLVDDGRSLRLLAGYRFRPLRFGSFAVEASLDGYGLGLLDRTSVVEIDAYQLSLAGRFNLPLANNFEAFARLGLHHTSAGAANPIYDTSGNGFLVGAGIAYRFNVGIGTGAAVGIDYQLNKVELSGERFREATAFDILERQWTLGVTLGF